MARIKTVAYIGWRGNLDFEPIELDNHFTGLVGVSGAGKSTLGLALAYALLPDRTYLDIKPITSLNDASQSNVEQLGNRVDELYGYAYVILDIETRDKTRLVAGICVRPNLNSSDISKWSISGVPDDYSLQDLFRVVDGEEQSYPDVSILKKEVSAKGFDFHQYQTVGEYCKTLHTAGILPTTMLNNDDRSLYAKLLETSFHGGVSAEVSKRLKSYVMPEESRIHESVSKLTECVNQALQTKRSLYETSTQLETIKGICNIGRDIVLTSFSMVKKQREIFAKHAFSLRDDIRKLRSEISKDKEKVIHVSQQITLTNQTRKNTTEAKYTEKEQLVTEITNLENERNRHKSVESTKNSDLRKLKDGEKYWKLNAAVYENLGWQQAVEATKKQIDLEGQKLYKLNDDIEKLQEKVLLISKSSNNPKADYLAQSLNAKSLADTLENASIEEARAVELMLLGLTDGVIGVTPNDLVNLQASKDLPDLFWVAKDAPKVEKIQNVGDWHLIPYLNGYSVMSKEYAITFGKQARLERKNEYEQRIQELSSQRQEQTKLKESLEDKHNKLHEFKDIIEFYFKNIQDEQLWMTDLQQAKSDIKKCEDDIKKLIIRQGELKDEIEELEKYYENQVNNLNQQQSKLNIKIGTAENTLSFNLNSYKSKLSDCKLFSKKYKSCMPVINNNIYLINGLIDYSHLLRSESDYIKKQTKNITELSNLLEEDKSIDSSFISIIDVNNAEDCVSVWPSLMKIMRERMPAELLDRDFDDLINEMDQRRSQLREKVELHEGQVKVQARNIAASITQQINSHSRKISNLNSLGGDVKFGNATGVRIEVSKKENMMRLLEKMSEQTSLFDNDERPIENIMRDFFEAALATKLDGVDLLDYRAYVELGIEVKRQGGDWKPAASLSGGESIGCGLAFALMLFRSLAARGEFKPTEIMPIFIIDELNRIDPQGQKLIADFCAKEGIQLIITAPQMEPSHEFKLYAIARNYNGREEMVVRELRGFHH